MIRDARARGGLNVPIFLGKLDPWFDSDALPRLKACRLPQFAAALKLSPALSFLVAWRSIVAYCGSRPATQEAKPGDLPGSARRRVTDARKPYNVLSQRAGPDEFSIFVCPAGSPAGAHRFTRKRRFISTRRATQGKAPRRMQSELHGDPSAVGIGVPVHLREHLHAPDREIFEVKAKLQALTKRLHQAEQDRDEALKVAVAADARRKAADEHASQKLEKVRTRAEAAERAAESSELLADATSAALQEMEIRAQTAEAELHRQTERVARLEEALEKQKAKGITLEDDVDILRRRVRNLERGISSFSKASQTASEDFVDSGPREEDHSFGVNAAELLRELEDVGTDAHIDATGAVRRATARDPREPEGLGVEIVPPRLEAPVTVPEDDWGPDASDDEEAEQRKVEEWDQPEASEGSALVAVASGEDAVNLEQEREERDTQEFKGLEGHVIKSAGVGEMEDDGWAGDDPSWVADKEL